MRPPPEEAFDLWFRTLGFRGRDSLSDLPESLRSQLRSLQTMYNEAFARERQFPAHAATLPLYFDFLDADEENALATQDGEHYAFIGITRHLVFKISDVCVVLSRSDGALCRALGVRPSAEPYNELQATLVYILLSFVVAHEWSHHKHGHLGQLSSRGNIFQEVLDSGLVGSMDDQIREIAADGYSAFFVLTHLFDEARSNFLPFLKFDPSPLPEVLDLVFLAFFVTAVAGYMLLRRADDLSAVNVYRFTHPPLAARLNFLMREVTAWCSHNRPVLEGWITANFDGLMNATSEAVLGFADYRQAWGNQIGFLKSAQGRQYTAALTDGIAAYRKSWGMDKEQAQIVEPPKELGLQFLGGPEDSELPKAVADVLQGLRQANVGLSSRGRAFDSVAAVGTSGIVLILATTLGPRAIIEFRKLLQSYLAHGGRKIKLKNGPISIEASADDFLKVFTEEQIQQLIEPTPKKGLPTGKRPPLDKG